MKRATNNLTPRHGLPTTAGAATIPRLSRSPATPHAFAWKLTEPIDRFANAIRNECGVDGGERDRHRWQQQLLTRAGYMDDGDLAVSSFLAPVGFHDEDRPDAFRTIAQDWTSGRAPVRSHPCRNLSIGRHHASAARISACYVDSTIRRPGYAVGDRPDIRALRNSCCGVLLSQTVADPCRPRRAASRPASTNSPASSTAGSSNRWNRCAASSKTTSPGMPS